MTFLDLCSAYRTYGYFVAAEAIPGEEALFAATLRAGLAKIDVTLASNAKQYGMRGLSKRALAALHAHLPVPAFGVEVY